MYKSGKILVGIFAFLILATSPLWMNVFGGTQEVPDLKYPINEKECVASKEYMRANHMDMLDDWREKVVREDKRYTEINGKKVEMSLSRTCMKCHDDKAEFCDKCHNYLEVSPYCWECHVIPEGGK